MPQRTIAEVGEFAFLSRVLPQLTGGRDTLVGPGQDCALIRCRSSRLLVTIDTLVEGAHFRSAWLSPRAVGRKSFLINASDAAAMGGQPRFCVVGLCVPPAYRVRDLARLQDGLVEAAQGCGATVVGGNLARADRLSVTVALLADAPTRTVTRQGARPGDHVYVTGTLGDAALGVRLLQSRSRRQRRAAPIRRFREPTPRLRAGRFLVDAGIVSAMTDVSDGLVQDLGHICTESDVGAVLRADAVPRSPAYRAILGSRDWLALHGGEDYELLCTVPERHVKRLERNRSHLGCAITPIGVVTRRRTLRVLDEAGKPVQLAEGGFDHFRRR